MKIQPYSDLSEDIRIIHSLIESKVVTTAEDAIRWFIDNGRKEPNNIDIELAL